MCICAARGGGENVGGEAEMFGLVPKTLVQTFTAAAKATRKCNVIYFKWLRTRQSVRVSVCVTLDQHFMLWHFNFMAYF